MVEIIIAAVVAIVVGFLIGYFLMQKVLKERNDATNKAEGKGNFYQWERNQVRQR